MPRKEKGCCPNISKEKPFPACCYAPQLVPIPHKCISSLSFIPRHVLRSHILMTHAVHPLLLAAVSCLFYLLVGSLVPIFLAFSRFLHRCSVSTCGPFDHGAVLITDLAILRRKKIEPTELELMETFLDGTGWNVVGVAPVSDDALVGMDMRWARKFVVSLSSTAMAPELVFRSPPSDGGLARGRRRLTMGTLVLGCFDGWAGGCCCHCRQSLLVMLVRLTTLGEEGARRSSAPPLAARGHSR